MTLVIGTKRPASLPLRLTAMDIRLYSIILVATLFLITFLMSRASPIPVGDTSVYAFYSRQIWHGHIPYRDFAIEYPPGSLIPIAAAQPLARLLHAYSIGFAMLATLPVYFIVRDRFRRSGQGNAIGFTVLLLPICLFIFFLLDIFAAAALYMAIRIIIDPKPSSRSVKQSAALLAVATLIKGYPLVCLPALVLGLTPGHRKAFLKTLVVVLVIAVLPFLLLSPGGVWSAVTYHSGRPLEINSSFAAIGFLSQLIGNSVQVFISHNSRAVLFPGSVALGQLSTLILALGFVAMSVWLYRRQQKKLPNMTALSCVALLVMFILAFKVGSMQFVIPMFLAATLAAEKLPRREQIQLCVRLLLIGCSIAVVLFFSYKNFPLRPHGDIPFVIRFLLQIELFIWLIRRLRSPDKTAARAVIPR